MYVNVGRAGSNVKPNQAMLRPHTFNDCISNKNLYYNLYIEGP